MIKTIKVKKKIQLDKLIRHVWDYEYFPIRIISDKGNGISFGTNGEFKSYSSVCNYDDLFEVEVEEEITENTKLDHLVEVTKGYSIHAYEHDVTINEVLDEDSKVFYTLIDGELVKVWGCE